MSEKLLDEWAQELKDSYGDQITARVKRQIKKHTTTLTQTIKNKEITFGEFSEDVTRHIAVISYLRAVLRSMLSDDLTEYKDYIRACIKEGYAPKDINETFSLYLFLEQYDDTRDIRLKKIKGILLQKLSKYSAA